MNTDRNKRTCRRVGELSTPWTEEQETDLLVCHPVSVPWSLVFTVLIKHWFMDACATWHQRPCKELSRQNTPLCTADSVKWIEADMFSLAAIPVSLSIRICKNNTKNTRQGTTRALLPTSVALQSKILFEGVCNNSRFIFKYSAHARDK